MKRIGKLFIIVMICFILVGCGNKADWPSNKYTNGLDEPKFGKLISATEDEEKVVMTYEDVTIEKVKEYTDICKKRFVYYNETIDQYENSKKYQFVGNDADYMITLDLNDKTLTITIINTNL